MFAQRFDPTSLLVETHSDTDDMVSAKVEEKVIPLKRKRNGNVKGSNNNKSDSDSDSESELDESDVEEEKSNDAEKTHGQTVPSQSSSHTEEQADNMEIDNISDNDDDNDDIKKHHSVLSRFQQSITLNNKLNEAIHENTIEEKSVLELMDEQTEPQNIVQNNELNMIPQPDIIKNMVNKKELIKNDLTNVNSTAFLNIQKKYYTNNEEYIKSFKDHYKDKINDKLLDNITENFSEKTFPVQTALLDYILPIINFTSKYTKKNLTRRIGDILVNASTGSGKTLAYSIPLVQLLAERSINRLRVLIIVPTKFLIQQVYSTLSLLTKGTNLIIKTSKLENSLNDEFASLQKQEPDILIITPGRLVDHLQLNSISLKNLKFLILDEADRLLNQSFQNWCKELLNNLAKSKSFIDPLPGNVCKLIFSATLTTNTSKLHDLKLHNPKLFLTESIKLYNLPKTLSEINYLIPTAKSIYKPLSLLKLLFEILNNQTTNLPSSIDADKNGNKNIQKILVFVKSNETSLRLNSLLKIILSKMSIASGISLIIDSINSNNSKAENKHILTAFINNKTNVLITTDLMSRGMDINNITEVINYDLPISSQQYVHRCGRTARANTNGTAYNFLVGKGERSFWSSNIDDDISRAIDTIEVANKEMIELNKLEETQYMECLELFKEQSKDKAK